MLAVECLDANVVQDLMSGALDDAARGVVLGHLDTCQDCRELLAVTASDTLENVIVDTQPYPAKLVKPRTDIGLDETVTPEIAMRDVALESVTRKIALDETVDTATAGLEATLASHDGSSPDTGRRMQIGPIAGKAFGRYTLGERLGAGAMGVVWRARDPKLGRDVALKLLKRHDPTLMDRLVREAQSMAQVSHPNVVGVYDVGVAEGNAYIAMELVTGKSLRGWQSAKDRTVPEIVAAYVAAGRGLAAAHRAGIVHRDFKPDNVLVGDDERVRVTDFGLAAAKPSESGIKHSIADVSLTTSGSVLGTPAYMAPEQFTGGNVDPRTDQFNFCASLYEALYGERPFEGKTFDELADNVIEGRVKAAPSGTQIAGGLRAIIVRGLSAKPGDRFATMDHLLAELGRDRARPWRRTAIGCAALAAALALGLVADWAVRDRGEMQIRQSFALTGSAIEKTVRRLSERFHMVSAIAYREQALRDVTGHYDQADFGLGTTDDDRAELERLHDTLASTEWVNAGNSQRAIVDYKGRLLYTSYAPQIWNTDMTGVPPIKRALDAGKGDSVTVVSYADPAILATKVLGSAPPTHGLALMFARVLALGDKSRDRSEARAIYLELEDATQLLDEIHLDEKTLLAIVSPDGTSISNEGLSQALVGAAPRSGDIANVTDGGHIYQVQSRGVHGFDGTTEIARVVMARQLDGVLQLFPGASLVFALAALAALGVAVATAMRARQITGARVV